MQIKSILAGAAIAIAASVGSAYAADQFATVAGVQAGPLSVEEMDAVRGLRITANFPDPIGIGLAHVLLGTGETNPGGVVDGVTDGVETGPLP